MFNIGFKDFIEKLEEYFGKRVTKFAVGLFGLAILVFVVGYAVTASVYPLALWIGAVVTGQPEVSAAISGMGTVATIVWLAAVLALTVSYFRARADLKRASEIIEEARQIQDDGAKLDAELREEALNVLAEAKRVADESAKEIKALRAEAERLGGKLQPNS